MLRIWRSPRDSSPPAIAIFKVQLSAIWSWPVSGPSRFQRFSQPHAEHLRRIRETSPSCGCPGLTSTPCQIACVVGRLRARGNSYAKIAILANEAPSLLFWDWYVCSVYTNIATFLVGHRTPRKDSSIPCSEWPPFSKHHNLPHHRRRPGRGWKVLRFEVPFLVKFHSWPNLPLAANHHAITIHIRAKIEPNDS